MLLTLLVGYPGYLLTGVLPPGGIGGSAGRVDPTDAVRRITDSAPGSLGVLGRDRRRVADRGVHRPAVRVQLDVAPALPDPVRRLRVFNVGAWLVIGRVLRRIEPEARPTMRSGSARSSCSCRGAHLASALSRSGHRLRPRRRPRLRHQPARVPACPLVLIGSRLRRGRRHHRVDRLQRPERHGRLDRQRLRGRRRRVLRRIDDPRRRDACRSRCCRSPTLDGAQLFGWNRVYWAITYLLASVLFVLVMLNVPGGLTAVPGDFLRWLGLYLAFAIIATAIWGIDRLLEKRREAARGATFAGVCGYAKLDCRSRDFLSACHRRKQPASLAGGLHFVPIGAFTT